MCPAPHPVRRDLTQHEESDTGVETLGPYQLHDLVQVRGDWAIDPGLYT